MNQIKFTLYGVTVVCYIIAGTLDLVQRHAKPGGLAIAFGILNIAIFFWRPE